MKATLLVRVVFALIALQLFGFNINSQTKMGYDSKFVNQSIPDRMTPGQKYNLIVTFQNSGSTSWVPVK
ncbi:MAG: hypothetical protein IPL53_00015 [Ignavibacteria bacterium]|nr:hypothetical protein [Ignavibacteria bacterium]